ncbi:glycoside hydrolase family 3 C-terminal domain-containing protein [Streptomyces pristinaespiralis]|uniref:glycoside hydrolase family 3 C-terminal domain-containing protein n=1 Tax=Streptomyces pristinaespiralis TaxID=38300 RepID=UPI003400847A
MDEEDLTRLLDKLDLRQKVRLLTGATTWRTAAEPAVGLGAMTMSDGPAGVRGEAWDEFETSALLPSATGLCAMWDEDLVERLGRLLADEARRKSVHVVLAPTLNIHRSPLAGRHFECFSEDPVLVGRTGAALIRGIQSYGVAAAAKHYVANDSETERLRVDVRVGERALREVYLAPFESAVEAGVHVVMSGYNGVNGATMTESALLAEPLKREWGFDGLVVSDWGAVRSTVAAALAGQDLAMPGPHGPWGDVLVDAVTGGAVGEEAVDDKVRRLLRLAGRVGALGPAGPSPFSPASATAPALSASATSPAPSVTSPAQPASPTSPAPSPSATAPAPAASAASPSRPSSPASAVAVASPPAPARRLPLSEDDRRWLLRRAVVAGSVLLENRGVLPLDAAALTTVALIGDHAGTPRSQGGGSAGVFPQRVTGPLDGIKDALGDGVSVVHVPGPRVFAPPPLDPADCRDPRTGRPGVLLRVLDEAGRELCAEHRMSGRQLEPPQPPGAYTVEISTRLLPRAGGEWTLGVGGFGHMSLTVDDALLLDGKFPRETDDPAVVHVNPPCHHGRVSLTAGAPVLVVARRQLAPDTGRAVLVTAAPPRPEPARAVADAVRAARDADVAIVCVGTTEDSESEGHDREDLALPGQQDALVRAVAAANPRTVVVVNAGSPVEMPWRKDVAAVLLTWFPGQEGGAGLADMLFGAAEPRGRLPTTWGARLADVPVAATTPDAGVLNYAEGLHIGHRAWLREGREPAYWFGHGLGYTTWDYQDMTVEPTGPPLGLPAASPAGLPAGLPAGPGGVGGLTVRVRLRNTGVRSGREVVQVYLAKPDSAVDRPVRWFAGYAAVEAAPGEDVTAVVHVPGRALRHWCVRDRAWRVEPGVFQVLVGPSAGRTALSGAMTAGEHGPG